MDELGEGGAKKAKMWPWWAGASAAQLTTGVIWFRRGKRGGDMTMPFRAFAIASLIVGAGATAVTAGVSAAGVGSVCPSEPQPFYPCDEFCDLAGTNCSPMSLYLQVAEMKDLGARIRRWSRVPPRRVEGGE
jgi:hypothetical protein